MSPSDAAGKVKAEPGDQDNASSIRGIRLAEPRPPLLFSRSEASLYTSLATLPQRAGVTASMLPLLVVKEFCDNALDAADAAGRSGEVEIGIDNDGNLIIEDQGTGIADVTPEQLASIFCVARPMLSSKLLRKPTRGCVGNGLRVCLGWLTATRGRLIVETGNVRVELAPEIDGTSRIVGSCTIAARQGVRLIAMAGDARFSAADLCWAEDAIELTQQSGAPAFTGRTSPHWHDADHFHILLSSAVGAVSVRRFLSEFDGLTSSKVQSRIATRFLRRAAADLNVDEATELLALARSETRPKPAKALRQLGRNAVIASGYAIAEGSFTEGRHPPFAQLVFLAECWADAFFPGEQEASAAVSLFMNRTPMPASCTGSAWHRRLDVSICGTALSVPVPSGPHYGITINITSPMFRMTSDGKMPDCHPFRTALINAIGKAAEQAGKSIAADLNAEERRAALHRRQEERDTAHALRVADREARQRRQAQLAEQKAERKKLPSIKDVVIELLPGALKIEAASGLLFGPRRLVYRIRDDVLSRTGKELEQGYFDRLLTAIEAEHGDLHPLLIREARGNFRVPHYQGGITLPLGTLTVQRFQRPAWTFNKIVTIEKEDLRLMLEQAGWDARHDALIKSSKGFNTRASRDLIDKVAETSEPVRVFSAHDADAAGTLIQDKLQNATLARGARKIEVIDIGLQPWEGVALGLHAEKVPIEYNKDGTPRRKPVGEYVRERTDRAPTGETWEEWLQHSRFELNAFTSAQLIDWLDQKMAEHGAGKLIPPADILTDQFSEQVRDRVGNAVDAEIASRRADLIVAIEQEQAEATQPIKDEIERITAPLLAEIARLSAPFLEQIDKIEQPYVQRVATVAADANALDREMLTHQAIERMTPDVDKLRTAIGKAFSDSPARHWEPVLHEIADATEVGAIDIDLSDGRGDEVPPR